MTIQERGQKEQDQIEDLELQPTVTMTTKERIVAELDHLNEAQLVELYTVAQELIQAQQPSEGDTFMDRLQRIKINAPFDFSTNWERYLGEEENA